jgi:hypothetical protein
MESNFRSAIAMRRDLSTAFTIYKESIDKLFVANSEMYRRALEQTLNESNLLLYEYSRREAEELKVDNLINLEHQGRAL